MTPDLTVSYHNEMGAEWLGDLARDFSGCNLLDIVPSHVLEKDRPHLIAALKGETVSYKREFTFNGRVGSSVANYIPHVNSEGQVEGLHLFIWDTTEETRLKKEVFVANEIFARAFNSTAVGMAIVSPNGAFLRSNDALSRMLGYSAEELKALDFQAITHPEDLFADLDNLHKLLDGKEESYSIEKRYIRKDGVVAHGILSVSAVRNSEHAVEYFVSQIQDISDRQAAEEKLHREHELSRVTLESIGDAVITFDAQGRATFLNPAAERITGWSDHDARGQDAHIIFKVIDRVGNSISCPVKRALENGNVVFLEPDCRLITRTGETVAIEDSAAPIRSSQNEIVGAVLVFHDVTQQRAMANQLAYLAHFDSLTGVANRILFREQATFSIDSATSRGESSAIFFCDLDRFKLVNDVHGHQAGDDVLKAIAMRLNALAGGTLTVCRWSGDEFALLAPPGTSAQDASEIAHKIVESCAEPIWLPSAECIANIGISVGISICPTDGTDFAELMAAADAALYEVKRDGRNGFRFHQSAFNTEAKMRAAQEMELRAAIRDNRFVVHYQPKVSLPDGRVVGFEALVRLVGGNGLIYPDQFIQIAERTGLIDDLTLIVFRKVCEHLVFLASGFSSDFRIAVNLSPASLKRTDISAQLGDILRAHDLSATRFELEITEGILVDSSDSIRIQLELLNSMGFSIALDDFGTGYSNLAYLRSLPIDKLKIDRSFISKPDLDAEIAGLIISLGKSLGKVVVAEGVETEQQQTTLVALKCDEGQGFLYARPLDFEQMQRYLREQLT